MYTDFFGFKDKPFSIMPDDKFLYLGKGHKECSSQILSSLRENQGLVVLTGGVGSGKTTLCRSALSQLSPIYKVAWVFEPHLDGAAFLKRINKELGIECDRGDKKSLLDELRLRLLEKKKAGWRVVLVVESAQNLSHEAAEIITALSGEEAGGWRLLQIILVGRQEFEIMLEGESLRKLRGVAAVWRRLAPLSRDETAEYVFYRMSVVGGEHPEIFPDGVINEIYRQSNGVPRLVNILCDWALRAAHAGGRRKIEASMVGVGARVGSVRTAGAGLVPRPAPALIVAAFMAVLWLSFSSGVVASGFPDNGDGGRRVTTPRHVMGWPVRLKGTGAYVKLPERAVQGFNEKNAPTADGRAGDHAGMNMSGLRGDHKTPGLS